MAWEGHISNVTFPARDGRKKARTVAGCVLKPPVASGGGMAYTVSVGGSGRKAFISACRR